VRAAEIRCMRLLLASGDDQGIRRGRRHGDRRASAQARPVTAGEHNANRCDMAMHDTACSSSASGGVLPVLFGVGWLAAWSCILPEQGSLTHPPPPPPTHPPQRVPGRGWAWQRTAPPPGPPGSDHTTYRTPSPCKIICRTTAPDLAAAAPCSQRSTEHCVGAGLRLCRCSCSAAACA
jgi:hypothetical protein